MWTYLLILVAVLALFTIFGRRVYLLTKNLNVPRPQKNNFVDEEVIADDARKISKADQVTVEALCQKGEAMIKAGKEDDAIKCFVQALALDANHLETQYKLGMLYMQKEMYGAVAALFKTLARLTEDAVHYSHLGLALYKQSNFEEALEAYQKAVSLDPSRPQRFTSLAMVYRSLGQKNLAIISLNKALEMDEKNLDLLFLMVDLQLEAEMFEEANKVLEKISALDPANKDAKALLKKLKKKVNYDVFI